jgi:integrase
VRAVHRGFRQGELLELHWKDTDLEDATLQVQRTLTTAKEGPRLAAPKTAKSCHTV